MAKKSLEERIAAAVREEVAIVPYDSRWPAMFESEAAHLRAVAPAGLIRRIEHFGSTSVPGLAAKAVVDLLVEVSSLEETRRTIVPVLEEHGYDYFWRPDLENKGFYAWFIKRDAAGKRTHHIHMVEAHDKMWETLLFRDYLREHPDVAAEYAALKRGLAEQHPNDREAYTMGKGEFIRAVTAKARARYLPG